MGILEPHVFVLGSAAARLPEETFNVSSETESLATARSNTLEGRLAMNLLTLSELFSILDPAQGPCVSLYISCDKTFNKDGLWSPQSINKYRKLLGHAEGLLLKVCPKQQAEELLEDLRVYTTLQPRVRHAQTLCMFSSPDLKGFYPISQKVTDICVVADSFHVTPIAEFVNPFRTWFLVKLTKSGLQCYRGRGPALEFISSFEISSHYRINNQDAAFNVEHDSVRDAPTYKKPTAAESQKFTRFSEKDHEDFDNFLESFIPEDCKRFPLLLAGTKTDTDAFVKTTKHNFDLTVNFSERYREFGEEKLRDLSWPKLQEHYEQDRKIALAGLSQASQTGLSTTDPEQVIARLKRGQLRLLAVSAGNPNWGSINWANGQITPHKEQAAGHLLDDCIYDDLIERALIQGCKVYLCRPSELPEGSRLLAV